MKLYEAIKRVIDCDGAEAVLDLRIINVLSDFQAYTDVPSSKYVLRAAIADGYVKRLLALGGWNANSLKLQNKFVCDTGFQQDIADYVFQSIAYGLGWKAQVEQSKSAPIAPPPAAPQPAPRSSKPSLRASDDVWEDYILNNLLEWAITPAEIEKEYGVKLSFSLSLDDNKTINLFTTITGKRKKEYMFIHYSAYNMKGRVTDTNFLCSYNPTYKSYKAESTWINLKASDISKIVIFV